MAMKIRNKDIGTVYSTDSGRLCPDCLEPAGKCRCRKESGPLQGDGIVRLMRETKGRSGKGVTLISGVPLDNEGLKKLAKTLKQKCGSGGTLKDGTIEIQGDHREVLEQELVSRGYKVKRAGG